MSATLGLFFLLLLKLSYNTVYKDFLMSDISIDDAFEEVFKAQKKKKAKDFSDSVEDIVSETSTEIK